MSLLDPDKLFSSVADIDVDRDLLSRGFDVVLLDIDNTIRSRETGAIPHDVGAWLAKARNAGVKFCLLSNNWHENVHEVADELELPIVAKAMKPLPFAYGRARELMGANRQQTVSVGDQLFTDVVGAHLAGIAAYMVAPLAETDLAHTLVLRNLERAIVGSGFASNSRNSVYHCEDASSVSSSLSSAKLACVGVQSCIYKKGEKR